jgi:transglutaminase-like putative cysteine protease
MRRSAVVVAVSIVAAAVVVVGAASHAESGGGSFARMTADPAYLKPGDTRTFKIRYVAHVTEVPAGAKTLRVWLPVPQDTTVQTITGLAFGDAKPTISVEKKYGDRIALFEVADPKPSQDFEMSFTCMRKEQVTDLAMLSEDGTETDASAATFLADDKLTIVDDRVRKLAAEIVAGRKTTVTKARAIYDYVREHMTYDKSGDGWGRGDTVYACDAAKGNCTDFHALFMSLCRAAGIPAGFEIGLYLPYERRKVEKPGGYHCWAFFRVPGKAWAPVDISEASKMADRADYFFGGHTSNRVTLSVGRDLVLEPAQAGPPLNYLVNPYAEADGKQVKATKDWEYEDL